MKVAITADCHLTTRKEKAERFNSLENILENLRKGGISTLIIAGDLFDKSVSNYNDFDSLCNKYREINFKIIPGNHDYKIEKRFYTSKNIDVIEEAKIEYIGKTLFLFIPYKPEITMDDIIAEFWFNKMIEKRWVLIGHGDYISKNRVSNFYEPEIYMPLSGFSINKYNPLRVFLGHIHKFSEFGKVIYPGSPIGIDINETGKRRFVIFDTESCEVEFKEVESDVIYFVEEILVLPFGNEVDYVKRRIDKMVDSWGLGKDEIGKVKLRIFLKGYTNDINRLKREIEDYIKNQKGISLYDEEGIIFKVNLVGEFSFERDILMKKLREKVELLNLSFSFSGVKKEEILEKAMEIIYGEK